MSKQVNEKKKKNSIYRRLFSYMKPYKVPLIFSIIFVFIGCFVYALAPLMLGNAINNLKLIFTEGYTAEVSEAFFIFLITMISCYLLYSIFTYLATHLIVACTENTIYDLRKELTP